MQVRNERGDHLGIELVDGVVAELGKDPPQRHAVRSERARGDVDARGLPARRNAPETLDGGTFGETGIWDAQRRQLTRQPCRRTSERRIRDSNPCRRRERAVS